jgi:DNA mismatch repair protein MutL
LSGKIVILPEALTHQIAAGEVVERPASIVKELLENALDAGATDIRIELLKGGCGAIRIRDNGEGSAPADAPRAFARYATSKIYRFEDLYSVSTFGFRGEALASIASISRVEMTTRIRGALAGTRIVVNAGRIEEIADTGSPEGTAITVTEIFDPVPVRKKFLKTETTERGYCIDVITRTALSYPQVRIQVLANDREILKMPAATDLSERTALILGMDFMDHLLPLQAAAENITLRGFVSRPSFTRSHARQIYSFVNRRYVRDYLLNHAIMTAYRSMIEARRYPAAVLMIDLAPEDVDVNVHPAKLEVRFRRPREIYGLIVETLTQSLAQVPQLPGPESLSRGTAGTRRALDYRDRVEEALKRYRLSSATGKLTFQEALRKGPDEAFPPVHPLSVGFSAGIPSEQAEAPSFSSLEYLGQIADTYLVFSAPDRMILLDQHAAHERILFEKLKRTRGNKTVSQQLLIPEVLHLSRKDRLLFEESMPILEEAGIEAADFGGDAVVIKSVPVMLQHVDARMMIADLLEGLSSDPMTGLQEREDKIFRLLACKAAVKANQTLSPQEAEMLCRDLEETPFAATCPHGRPVYRTFGIEDLEKMFKRK